MFFESFSEGPRGFSYTFLITCKVPTLEPIDGPTFVFYGVLILGENQEVFNGAVTLDFGLYAILTTDLFDAFAWTLGVRYDNLSLFNSLIASSSALLRFGEWEPLRTLFLSALISSVSC